MAVPGRLGSLLVLALWLAPWGALGCSRRLGSRSAELDRTIVVDGRKRSFSLHVPAGHSVGALPLVIVLHGGGGTARGMRQQTRGKLDELSDRDGFVVAYPDGVGKHWNDGRLPGEDEASREHVDDVAFLAAMIDAVGRELSIDPKRVFATGISNGGMMSYRLACDLSARIAAIAPVVASMSPVVVEGCHPGRPVPVLAINGTSDPLVPWEGGQVHFGAKMLGEVLPVRKTVEHWARLDSCHSPPVDRDLPDRDPSDGVRAHVHEWGGCAPGADVVLYELEGGGHTWPGGEQYLPSTVVGPVCRDFDASEVAWEFFQRHPMR